MLETLHDVGATTWGDGSIDHIAVLRPLCGDAGGACNSPAMIWRRCRCRRVFARCHQHTDAAGVTVAAAIGGHDCHAEQGAP